MSRFNNIHVSVNQSSYFSNLAKAFRRRNNTLGPKIVRKYLENVVYLKWFGCSSKESERVQF